MPCISINSGHLSISLSLRSPAPDKAFTTYTCSSQPPSAVPAICQYSHSVTSLFHLSTHSLKIHPHNPLDQYWINKAALHVPLCLITHKHTLLFKAKLISAYQCPYMFSFCCCCCCLQNSLMSITLLPIPCLPNICPVWQSVLDLVD